MRYKLTNAHRLQVEADRVQGILEIPVLGKLTWEAAELVDALRDRGLDYTPVELVAIRTELLSRGVIEQVP